MREIIPGGGKIAPPHIRPGVNKVTLSNQRFISFQILHDEFSQTFSDNKLFIILKLRFVTVRE